LDDVTGVIKKFPKGKYKFRDIQKAVQEAGIEMSQANLSIIIRKICNTSILSLICKGNFERN
jgi:hypothetical protein